MARKYEVRSGRANHHNQQLAKQNQEVTHTENVTRTRLALDEVKLTCPAQPPGPGSS